MILNAFAKVNLFLSVGEKRPDGYHDIETVMHTVSICDRVEITYADTLTVVSDMDIPMEDNLAYKAASAFFSYTGITPSVKIEITKRIPSQAGMGGGSADAAAVLNGLNQMYKTNLTKQTLADIGVSLGADIPFLVYGGKALCRGIGEKITPMEKESLHLAVIKPEVGCPTGKMYGELDKTEREIPEYTEGLYFNSFDFVCPAECKTAISRLYSLGAETAMLSGSGSACFGIFKKAEDAVRASELLKKEYPFSEYAQTV